MSNFYFDREDIYKMILLSEQTKCGVYWFDSRLFLKKGDKKDEGFLLDRECFFEKRFWTQKDLSYLMATGSSPKLFVEDWLKLNKNFVEDNRDLLGKKLKDLIGFNRVYEIIDVYLYKKDYYYCI